MIDFDKLEARLPQLRLAYVAAAPVPHVVIDGLCDPEKLAVLVDQIPSPDNGEINKSRDYVFAKNKFEKSNFREIGTLFDELYTDLMSDRFRDCIREITGHDVFVDPAFHGGGIHQGGRGSFLDMHVDFSHHPLHSDWLRMLNILLYLNRDWEPDHGGQLNLRHRTTGASGSIEPLFNRCVLMRTDDQSLHGYDQLNFPDGQFRRSVATYAYMLTDQPQAGRSTMWFPEQGGMAKKLLGRAWPQLVAVKTKLFGSATSKNR